MSFEYLDEYKYLSSACLNLTDDCNMICRYCFVAQHPNYMTLPVAKAAVDYLVGNLRIKKEKGYTFENDETSITYFGGEPTLMWDSIIVPLTKYIKENYPDEVSLNMTTNGTLLNKERIDFLYENDIHVLLSIDGYKNTQDYNRPCKNNNSSSFDLVVKNIPYLLEKFPDTTFRSTIYAPTVEYTFENYIFANYMGFKNIFMIPNCRDKWSEEDKKKLKKEIENIYDYIRTSFQDGKDIINFSTINDSFERVLEHDIKIYNKDKSRNSTSRSCQRCGLGTGYGSIGYNGDIYGCQEQDSRGKESKFYLGNIAQGIDINKHKNLLADYYRPETLKCENEELCENCKLKNTCHMQACPSTTQDLYNSFFIDSEIHCLWQQFLFDEAIKTMQILVPENNLLFKNYLNYRCNYNKYFKEEEQQ